MIICLSPSDDVIKLEVKGLALRYKENYSDYKNGFAVPTEFCDKRLTIIGHGNYEVFGDERLTPEKLAADILAANFLKTVEIIDLVGCGIGQVNDNGSYTHRVLEILAEHGYPNIQIRSFTNLISEEPIKNISICSGPSSDRVVIIGMTTANAVAYQKELEAAYALEPIASLVSQQEDITNEIVRMKNKIRELQLRLADAKLYASLIEMQAAMSEKENMSPELLINFRKDKLKFEKKLETLCHSTFQCSSTSSYSNRRRRLQQHFSKSPKSIEQEIERLREEIPLLNSQLSHCKRKLSYHKVMVTDLLDSKFAKEIYSGNDIRRALDNNANFHDSMLITKQYALLTDERKQILRVLHNRIAELKEELYQHQHDTFLGYFLSKRQPLQIREELVNLTKLIDQILSPERSNDNIHFDLFSAKQHGALFNCPKTLIAINKAILILKPFMSTSEPDHLPVYSC